MVCVSTLWCLSQHLPCYLGFSYLGRGVSLHGCSSKAQPLLLTLDEGELLTAAPPDLERGVAPLGPLVPASTDRAAEVLYNPIENYRHDIWFSQNILLIRPVVAHCLTKSCFWHHLKVVRAVANPSLSFWLKYTIPILRAIEKQLPRDAHIDNADSHFEWQSSEICRNSKVDSHKKIGRICLR